MFKEGGGKILNLLHSSLLFSTRAGYQHSSSAGWTGSSMTELLTGVRTRI